MLRTNLQYIVPGCIMRPKSGYKIALAMKDV